MATVLDEPNSRFVEALLTHLARERRRLPVHPDLRLLYPHDSVPKIIRERTMDVLELAREVPHPFHARDLVPIMKARWGYTASTALQYLQAVLANARLQGWINYRHWYYFMGPVEQITAYQNRVHAARKKGRRDVRRALALSPYSATMEPHVHRQWIEGLVAELVERTGPGVGSRT